MDQVGAPANHVVESAVREGRRFLVLGATGTFMGSTRHRNAPELPTGHAHDHRKWCRGARLLLRCLARQGTTCGDPPTGTRQTARLAVAHARRKWCRGARLLLRCLARQGLTCGY